MIMGSHLDTQPTGGKFDGVYGVLAGLEVVESLNDSNIVTEHPVEIVVWTNEEGARFSPAMIGSGVFAGVFDLEYGRSRAAKDSTTIGEALDALGYAGKRPCTARPIREPVISLRELAARPTPMLMTSVSASSWFSSSFIEFYSRILSQCGIYAR